MSALYTKTLTEISDRLQRKEVSCEEVVRACLARIAATEPKLNACISVCAEEAVNEARAMDQAGPDASRPLWGVPVTVKDCIATKGLKTTCASRMLENFTPFYDAWVVEQLKKAGAVVVAKSNMDEFAMGSSTENSRFGSCHNPFGLDCVPGGSSGGAAAGIAAGQAFGALGTDTGGSIRQPASFCGCVGLKPTYGRVSRYGAVAFASSLDQIGCLTRSVEDAARMLGVIAAYDSRDATCAPSLIPDYAALLSRVDLKGIRLGLPKEFWQEGLCPDTRARAEAAVEAAKSLGAEIVDVSLPHAPLGVAVFYIIATAEASTNLGRFDGIRYGYRAPDASELIDLYEQSRTEGFGEEVKRRIILGTFVLSSGYYDAYYKKAAQVRALIRDDFNAALQQCDFILGPVSPSVPWKLGEISGDPLKNYLMDVLTVPLNLAGLPGLSIPAGLGSESKLPVGVQLIGPSFSEDKILQAGHALSQALGVPAMPLI